MKTASLRMVVLDVRRDPSTWGELGILVSRWLDVEEVTSATGPRVYLASRTTFRELEL